MQLYFLIRGQEILFVFILEVRGENILSHIVEDFLSAPKSAASQFLLAWFHLPIVNTAVYIHQFLLSLALEDVMSHGDRFEIGNAQLLPHLSMQGLLHTFSQVDMSTARRVPLVGLDILPSRTVLEIQVALIIKKV